MSDKRKERKRQRRRKRKERGKRRRTPPTSVKRSPPLKSVMAYLTLSQFAKRSTPPHDLIDLVKRCEWQGTFRVLALLAARLAREPLKTSKDLMGALASLHDHPHPPIARAAVLAANYRGDALLLHEEVIYFLQALVILVGGTEGPVPQDGQLALWALIANEHLYFWQKPDARPLTDVEGMLAEFGYAARFNHNDDGLRVFTRAALLFERRPVKAKLGRTVEQWEELQQTAFGKPFAEAYRTLFGPLFLMSNLWGNVGDDGNRHAPVIEMPSWIAPTRLDTGDVEA